MKKRKLTLKKVTLQNLDPSGARVAGGVTYTCVTCYYAQTCGCNTPQGTCNYSCALNCTLGNCGETWQCNTAGYPCWTSDWNICC